MTCETSLSADYGVPISSTHHPSPKKQIRTQWSYIHAMHFIFANVARCRQHSCTSIILRMHTLNMIRCKFCTFMSKILCRNRRTRQRDKQTSGVHIKFSTLTLGVIEIVHRVHFSDYYYYYYFSFLFVFVFVFAILIFSFRRSLCIGKSHPIQVSNLD